MPAAFTEVELRTVINEFVFAPGWAESRWVLAKHPELLTDDVDFILLQIKAMAREKGSNQDVELAETYRKLLRRCRIIGDKAAFAEIGHDFPPLSADLIKLTDTASEAALSFQQTHDAQSLGQAIDAFEAGIRQRVAEFDSAPLETVDYILELAISMRSLRFDAQRRGDDIDAGLAHWNALLQRASGSLATVSARASGTGGSLLLRAHLAGRRTLPAAVEALEHAVAAVPPGPEREGFTQNLNYARRLLAEQ